MSAILKLAEEVKDFTADADKKFRFDRQRFIESELVEFRPNFMEASEILASLKTGLSLRMDDNLPLEVEHAFHDLKMAFDACEAALYEPEAYDSIGEDDIEYRKE